MLRETIYQDSIKNLQPLSGEIQMMKPCSVAEDQENVAGEHRKRILSLAFIREMVKYLLFPISSRARETMMPFITQYTMTGSLYYTDDWFAYTSLPIRGNHVVVLKEKGIPKGRNHISGIEGFWSFAKHWLYQYRRGIHKTYFPLYLKRD